MAARVSSEGSGRSATKARLLLPLVYLAAFRRPPPHPPHPRLSTHEPKGGGTMSTRACPSPCEQSVSLGNPLFYSLLQNLLLCKRLFPHLV